MSDALDEWERRRMERAERTRRKCECQFRDPDEPGPEVMEECAYHKDQRDELERLRDALRVAIGELDSPFNPDRWGKQRRRNLATRLRRALEGKEC